MMNTDNTGRCHETNSAPAVPTFTHQIGIRQWEENEDILKSGSEANG